MAELNQTQVFSLPEEFRNVDSPARSNRYNIQHIPPMGPARDDWIKRKMSERPDIGTFGNSYFKDKWKYYGGKPGMEEFFDYDPVAIKVIGMMPNSKFNMDSDYRSGDILSEIFERVYRYKKYHDQYPNMPLYLPGIDYNPRFAKAFEASANYDFTPDKFTVDKDGNLELVQSGGRKRKFNTRRNTHKRSKSHKGGKSHKRSNTNKRSKSHKRSNTNKRSKSHKKMRKSRK